MILNEGVGLKEYVPHTAPLDVATQFKFKFRARGSDVCARTATDDSET